ncbi:MAG: hypothetical protein H6698_01445 [Myxococcales bacterium]|nr:hypothetical protein [Myxococcales bacterium]MCB9531064.1 hypothetical protein [Myxococcales bacterium]MCB9532974.1 hypothetical protein [Myxococcales bacterium]
MTPCTLRGAGFAAGVLVAATSASGCNRAPAPEPVLVFSDDFARDALGDDWQTASPTAWTVTDGQLAGEGAQNEGVWLEHPLPERVRVEFTATALSADGDLKFEIFTDGHTHQSGYIGIFGGWRNTLNVVARLDEHGEDRLVGADGKHVEVGRAYRFRVERTDGRVRWSIDGEPFMTYSDPQPLRGEAHAYFGFNDWTAPVRFDDVAIWDLAGAGR